MANPVNQVPLQPALATPAQALPFETSRRLEASEVRPNLSPPLQGKREDSHKLRRSPGPHPFEARSTLKMENQTKTVFTL